MGRCRPAMGRSDRDVTSALGLYGHIIGLFVLVDTGHGLDDGLGIFDGNGIIGNVIPHATTEQAYRQPLVALHQQKVV